MIRFREREQDVNKITIGFGFTSSVFSDDCADETVHHGDEVGAPEPDILGVEMCKKRKVVGPIKQAQQVITLVH